MNVSNYDRAHSVSDRAAEVAAKAMLGGDNWWPLNDTETQLEALSKARVVLQAVVDAFCTDPFTEEDA